MDNIPTLSADLIDLIDLMYPRQSVKPNQTMETIMYNAGRRDVVDTLIYHMTQQNKENPDVLK